MKFLYNFFVALVSLLLKILPFFSKKMQLFVLGRRQTFQKLAPLKHKNTIWFHAASLGEFEQARPIIEEIKQTHPKYHILVTFFSPSGYEVRKNYPLADVVCYLPLDTKKKAKKFVEIVHPKMAIFVKYEFWPNLLNTLKSHAIPTLLISGIVRDNQIFFKWYGGFMRDALSAFHHFFVQDNNSKELLNRILYTNITVAGDTRFDRVSKIVNQDNTLNFITDFKDGTYTLVAGSTWPEDEELLVNYINNEALLNEKFIIAPHNIKNDAILELQKLIQKKTVLYSEKSGKNLADYQVLIVDTIGILTKIYAAADVAYVGGGLKTGLHNILEPATFGIPVVIGNNYDKFKEAVDLVSLGGVYAIRNQQEFTQIVFRIKNKSTFRLETGAINAKYIQENRGATQKIMNYLNTKL